MLHAPDVYMEKLAIGPGYKKGVVTLTMTPSERVSALAAAQGCSTQDITVCVLERPRHERNIGIYRKQWNRSIYLSVAVSTCRITSYNVCYTKLLRSSRPTTR